MPMKKRMPKVGFRSKLKKDTAEVLLYQLDKLDVAEIDFAVLRAAKLVPATAKQAKIVKKGELTKKFVLKGVLATAGAKAAIEAAGGSVRVILWRRLIPRQAPWVGSANSPSSASD